jgi:hypothetical protein
VRRELILAASGERRHLGRFGVGLVVEEHAEVVILDRPEADLPCRAAGFRHARSLPCPNSCAQGHGAPAPLQPPKHRPARRHLSLAHESEKLAHNLRSEALSAVAVMVRSMICHCVRLSRRRRHLFSPVRLTGSAGRVLYLINYWV